MRPTHLLHLAWYAEPGKYQMSEQNYAWCRAGIDLLRAFAAAGGRRAVFAGSCFEYDHLAGICSETDTRCAPTTRYGACKLALSEVVTHPPGGISTASGRIFYLYGPGERPSRLVPTVIRSLLRDEPAQCTHGVSSRLPARRRCASAFGAILDGEVEGIVNIGSGEEITVRALVEIIADAVGVPRPMLKFGAIAAAPGDSPRVVADIRRMRAEVGFRPRRLLGNGLVETVEWWRSREFFARERPRNKAISTAGESGSKTISRYAHFTSARLLARNTILNLLGQAAPFLVALVAIPILVHHLGDKRYGVMTLAWLVVGYFGVFDMGLSRAATKLVAEALGADEFGSIAAVVWTALAMMTVFGALGGVRWRRYRLGWSIESSIYRRPCNPRRFTPSGCLRSRCPSSSVGERWRECSRRSSASTFSTRSEYRRIFSYLAPLAVLAFSHSVFWIVSVLVAGRVASWGVYFLLCIHVCPSFGRRIVVRRAMLAPLFSFGGWVTVSEIIGPVMHYFDRFLISAMISVAAVAYYSVPFQAASKLTSMPGAVAGVMFPALSMELAADPARAARLFDRAVAYVFIAIFQAALVAAVFAPEIMTLWIGSDFGVRSFWVMRWIALAAMVNGLAYLPFGLVQAAHRARPDREIPRGGDSVFLAGLWLGLRVFGVEGAAFVYLGRVAFDATLLYWAAARILPDVRTAVVRTALRLTGGAVAIGLAFVVAAPALRATYVALVVTGFGAWGWRTILVPSERESVRMACRAAIPQMSQ